MSLSLRELADLTGGRITGDENLQITGAETIRDARAGDITLATNDKLADQLAESSATAVVVSGDFQPQNIAIITVENVHDAFATIVSQFRPPRNRGRCGVSPHAHVSPTAAISHDVDIYPGAFVDVDVQIDEGATIHSGARILAGARIGKDVTIFPNVVVYEDCVIGDRSVIHGAAIIGATGYGYTTVDGVHKISAQLGNVEIGEDVEIGAGTTIDRGTFTSTTIGDGTKIDNQVQIAHNCKIGRHNLICAQVGIAGSCSTGDYVVMGGQVGLKDHVHIESGATLCAQAGIMHDIKSGETHFGTPSTDLREQMIRIAAVGKLPAMRKRLKELENQVAQLLEQNNESDLKRSSEAA